MGGVPVKKHTKSKVNNRRSQLTLEKRILTICSNCSGPLMPHRLCRCGFYKGRSIKEKIK